MRYPYAGLKRLLASLPLLLGGAAQADVALNHICDPVDPKACLLPFPNNWFTTGDSSTATGRRVNLSNNAMPRSVGLFPIGASEWNRNDGFSPGTPIITHVPGLDLAQTGAAPITDIGRSLASDAPIVLLNTLTGERWPYWAELDARASPDRRVLIIRPAKNLQEGVRYLVLLRNLRDATGNVLTPNSTVAQPAVAPGRNPDLVPYWNIPGLTGSPYAGSALVIWDSGTPNPPLTNLPPEGSAYGADPHGHPRRMPNARVQKAHFLKTGEVIDVCGGAPCVAQ
jgi:hypothetical protein